MKTEKEAKRVPMSSFLKAAPALIVSGIIISGALMAAATWAGSIAVDKQTAVTLTGTVSDSLCGNDHGIKAKGDPECTRMCVKLGAEYALVVGNKLYVLQGHQADLDRFAGKQVRVQGPCGNAGYGARGPGHWLVFRSGVSDEVAGSLREGCHGTWRLSVCCIARGVFCTS